MQSVRTGQPIGRGNGTAGTPEFSRQLWSVAEPVAVVVFGKVCKPAKVTKQRAHHVAIPDHFPRTAQGLFSLAAPAHKVVAAIRVSGHKCGTTLCSCQELIKRFHG